MKKIKVGIPRALLYHRYGVLWKIFFEKMNYRVIISPETNEDILKLGIDNSLSEYCLSYKIYLGHILYLKNKCDYILIASICNYGHKEEACPIIKGLYDTIKYLIPQNEIINYNLDYINYKFEFSEFLKIGYRLNRNFISTIYSYIIAKNRQKYYNLNKEQEEKNKLYKSNLKVLLVSSSYNIRDKLISKDIINILESNDITIIYSDRLNKSLAESFSDYFMDDLELKYSKEIIGSIYYYRYQINGVIFISIEQCNIDSIINNLALLKNNYLPTLKLIINENTNKQYIEKKLLKFIEYLKGANNEK